MRRTKIVATLGPATSTAERIGTLIDAGVDVVRLNFSHGTHAEHAERIAHVRAEAARRNRPIAILQDLQGPKIRTGNNASDQPILLATGQHLSITTEPVAGTSQRISTTYEALPRDVTPGDRILLQDGLIELRVSSVEGNDVHTTVIHGGQLRSRQGINLPNVRVSAAALTPKDEADLAFGLSQGIDMVAISFVRRAEDIRQVRQLIIAAGNDVPVIAKIEKPEALEELDAILEVVDGVMVARGDLGVEMPPEQVPIAQKRIIAAANRATIPVITATEMLQSMIASPRPTRAEASDVANAILDGTDAVMLSGETATGQFPIESVEIMARIAEATENSGHHTDPHAVSKLRHRLTHLDTARAIGEAVDAIAETGMLCAIVAFTQSGSTARMISHFRPRVPIYAFTPHEHIYRRLNLFWGVQPVLCPFEERLDDLSDKIEEIMVSRRYAAPGDVIAFTAGHPIATRGRTNLLKLMTL